MCELPYFKHKFYDIPDQNDSKEPLIFKGVYILFARPYGQAKMQYCERCGKVRLVAADAPDAETIKLEKNLKWLKRQKAWPAIARTK